MRYILITTVIVVQAVALLALLVRHQQETERVMQNHAFEILENLLVNVSDNTQRYLLPATNMARLSSSLMAEGVLVSTDDAALEQYFLAQLKSSDHITNIYLGRQDGSFVFVSRYQHGYRSKIITVEDTRSVSIIYRDSALREVRRFVDENDTYDPRQRTWFPLALNSAGHAVWSTPYIFFSSQRPGITVSTTVLDSQNNSMGVIGVDIELEGLSQFISTIPIGSHGSTALYTAEGDLIASNSLAATQQIQRISHSGSPPKVAEAAPSAIRVMLSSTPTDRTAMYQDSHEQGTSRQPKLNRYSFTTAQDVVHYGVATPFSIDTASDANTLTPTWYVAAEAPLEDFIGQIRKDHQEGLRDTLIIGIAALLLSIFVLFFGVNRPFKRLYRRATMDRVTQLWNKNEFMRYAEKACQQVSDKQREIALAVIDLEGFRPVNYDYGHAVGEEVLRIFAERLRHTVKPNDIIGRLAADEFGVILYDVHVDDVLSTVERIRVAVTKDPIRSSVDAHSIGATIGVTAIFAGLPALKHLEIADEAMLGGKRIGRNSSYVVSAQHLLEALLPHQEQPDDSSEE